MSGLPAGVCGDVAVFDRHPDGVVVCQEPAGHMSTAWRRRRGWHKADGWWWTHEFRGRVALQPKEETA